MKNFISILFVGMYHVKDKKNGERRQENFFYISCKNSSKKFSENVDECIPNIGWFNKSVLRG